MSSVNEWTLEPWHLRVAFRRAGIWAPDYAIELPNKPIHGPNPNVDEKDFLALVTVS